MTRAVVYTEFGGPEVLRVIETPTPEIRPAHLIVRVEAAGVNPIDAKLRSGVRASAALTAPRRIGRDGAGVVVAVGDDVQGFRVGDPIAFHDTSGTYASELRVAAHNAVPRPPAVSAAEAAGIGIPVGTAYQVLRSLDVGAGDTLLLHAGSGSVGQAAIQYAVLWGATVIATGSEERFDRVRELGATPVTYGEGLLERVRRVAPQGITVAFDAAGTDEALEVSCELVADRNRIGTIVRGQDATNYGVRAFGGGSSTPLTETELHWRAEAFPVTMALLAAGSFSIEHGPVFSLDEAAEAHRAIERGVDGKIVIVP
jgi:NADPH:quinone reductase-like Zn-dependent oxidoreductase